MKKDNEDFIIKEDFKNSDDCLHYFLNMFGKLDVAFRSERIKRRTYRKTYKFLEKSLFENLKLISSKSKKHLSLDKKELKLKVQDELKKIKLGFSDEQPKEIENAVVGQIEDSK